MSSFSNYLEEKLLNHTLRPGNTYAAPSSIYIGLHTSSVNDDNSGSEVSTVGSGYARKSVTFGAPTSGKVLNTNLITFSAATQSWGYVRYFGIYDAITGGNLLYWGELSSAKPVDIGDVFTFPIGNISISID